MSSISLETLVFLSCGSKRKNFTLPLSRFFLGFLKFKSVFLFFMAIHQGSLYHSFKRDSYERKASSTCAVVSISSISGVTSTNVRSVGVRAGSIHVTRVISFTLVNIWETIDTFCTLLFYRLKISKLMVV